MSYNNFSIAEAAGIGLTTLLRTQFDPKVADMVHRHGNPISQRIKPGRVIGVAGAAADEGGYVFQMRTSHADSARTTRDASRDLLSPKKSTADKLRVRFLIDDPANNDMNRFETSARLHITDLERSSSSPEVARNILNMVMDDALKGIDTMDEVLLHADENANIGAINGTPKANDDLVYDSCGAYLSGDTARIKVDGFSFAIFKNGQILDFYGSDGTLKADNIKVVDPNEVDFSIGLARTDDTTVANLDGLADNVLIYRSGEKGQGYKGGLGSIFKTDYTGDNWFGGKDRSATGNGHYIPVRTRTTDTPAPLSNRIVDRVFRALGYRRGTDAPGRRPTMILGPEALDNWRYSVQDTVQLSQPAVNDGKLQAGSDGLTYLHPAVGRVDVVSTLTARNDRLYVIYPDDWQMLWGEFRGHKYLTGNGSNVFERMPGTTNGGGGSVWYRMEAMGYKTPFCEAPSMQAVAFNIN